MKIPHLITQILGCAALLSTSCAPTPRAIITPQVIVDAAPVRAYTTFQVGDREILKYHGRFVGAGNKSINLYLRTGGSHLPVFESATFTEEGIFELEVTRYRHTANFIVAFTSLFINGVRTSLTRYVSNNSSYRTYDIRGTTVDAGGIILDAASHVIEKTHTIS